MLIKTRFGRCGTTALFLLALIQPATARTAGFLGRQGTQIVNDTGPVLLHGVNLGDWLYNEAYMTGAPFENDTWPAGLKDVLGTDANVAAFYAAWRSNYVSQADINRIKALGFNSVRVPLDWKLFYDTNTAQLTTNGFLYLDHLLNWSASAGLFVIPDMHGTPGGQRDPGTLFFDPTNQAILSNIWLEIAARYSTNQWIGGFDLINEPVVNTQSNKWRIRDLYVRLTAAIRSVDPNHLIFAEGNYYGADLYDLAPRWDENMAFSNHNYWTPVPSIGVFGLGSQVNLANTANVPLWLGEFGENSNPWLNAEKRSVEGYGIGWAVWPYKICGQTIKSVAWSQRTPGYQSVLNYWNGTGSKPTPSAAFAALIDMAQRMALSACQENRDFVDALIRPDFHTTSIPFSSNALPGRIYAANYDLGDQGVAYSDTVYQATNQSGTAWNNGWLYRNDGVDLGYSSDYYVGWTDTNEWLSFTVVSSPGRPTVGIRYSSPSANRLHVETDGRNITGSILLPATGGWFNWTTLTLNANTNLSIGVHTMKVVLETGGLNLYWLEFSALPPLAPPPWSGGDIGGPGRVGHSYFNPDTMTWVVAGGGADISAKADQFRFASRDFPGDGTLIARVKSVQSTDPSAKAGVMFRDSTTTNSMYAYVFIAPSYAGFECRTNTGGTAFGGGYGPGNPPMWVKLNRSGNTFRGSISADGINWTQLGSAQSIPMSLPAKAGLAVTAHNDSALCTATFDHVSPGPPVSLVASGEVWKYYDGGANLGTAWRSNSFSDVGWASGPAMLGYGNANGIFPRTTNSFGPDPLNKYITTYYRRAFLSPDPTNFAQLVVRVQRDDGVIVFLNGAEIFRSNMPTGAVDFLTLASTMVSGVGETTFYSTNVSLSNLLAGTNLLAAEIHQSATNSSNIAFDLALDAYPSTSLPSLSTLRLGNQLNFIWPGWSSGYTLWSATNLLPPMVWARQTNTLVLSGAGWQMSLPAPVNGGFFRLVAP